MKKTVFKNQIFYILLISLIIGLLIYNVYVLINAGSIYGIIPIFFELILLTLIYKKNGYAKIAILIWTIISSIIGFGFEVIANLIDGFNNSFKTFKIDPFLANMLGLIIGILIIDFTRRTVMVDYDPD